MDQKLLLSKFKGALVGALVGDACGESFEFCDHVNPVQAKQYLDDLEIKKSTKTQRYTDDSAMTIILAKNLVEGFSQEKLAAEFAKEYFRDPDRCYGGHVVDVFEKLKKSNYTDPTVPAREQFGGSGSFGNGGAMRIAPIALYAFNNIEEMVKLTKDSTEVTHTVRYLIFNLHKSSGGFFQHKLGFNGALLQVFAIHQALTLDPSDEFSIAKFADGLIEKISKFEDEKAEYQIQLEKMKKLLEKETQISEVIDVLGRDEEALFSVPTAIYCFLKGQKDRNLSSNPFRTTLETAICIGGDADTIASMACAISGAYYGVELINQNLANQMEAVNIVLKLAERIFEKAVKL